MSGPTASQSFPISCWMSQCGTHVLPDIGLQPNASQPLQSPKPKQRSATATHQLVEGRCGLLPTKRGAASAQPPSNCCSSAPQPQPAAPTAGAK